MSDRWFTETIETERLRLRAPGPNDGQLVAELMGDAEVRKYLGGPLPADELASIDPNGFGQRWGSFMVEFEESTQGIGSVSFGRDRGELEVSYEMIRGAWGHGLASEAVQAALDWAWVDTDDVSIIAVTQSANQRSCRLLEGLGFVEESRFEEFDAEQVQYRLQRP